MLYADYFHVSPGKSAKGSFSRFDAPETRFEVEYDAELAGEIAERAQKNGLPAGPLGEKDAKLDHGVMVPMWPFGVGYAVASFEPGDSDDSRGFLEQYT